MLFKNYNFVPVRTWAGPFAEGGPLVLHRVFWGGRCDLCSVDCSVTFPEWLIVLGSGEFGGRVNASGALVNFLQPILNSIIGPHYPAGGGGGPLGVVSTKSAGEWCKWNERPKQDPLKKLRLFIPIIGCMNYNMSLFKSTRGILCSTDHSAAPLQHK